jgi:outer membrane immunogenic protein
MKKLLLGSVALAAFAAGPTMAADMAVRAPVLKAAPPAAIYNWSGFYIGGHAGGAWGTKDWSFVDVGPTFTPIVPPTVTSHDISGFLAGGQIGVNWQTGNVVFGLEADASWTNASGSSDCPTPNLGGVCESNVKWVATGTGRLGYAWDRVLVYAKGGAAWARDEYFVTFLVPPIPTGNEKGTQDRFGWTAGGGVEFAITPNWSVKAEYNYLDFGTKGVSLNRINTGVHDETSNMTQRMHLAKIGLNYRFDWGNSVVARY